MDHSRSSDLQHTTWNLSFFLTIHVFNNKVNSRGQVKVHVLVSNAGCKGSLLAYSGILNFSRMCFIASPTVCKILSFEATTKSVLHFVDRSDCKVAYKNSMAAYRNHLNVSSHFR